MEHTISDKLCIGRLGKPFGVKGLITFISYSGETSHFEAIQSIEIGVEAEEHKVREWFLSSPIRCKLEGVHTPEQARLFTGKEVKVLREYATPLDEGEYYLADLQYLKVLSKDMVHGIILGLITDISPILFEIQWLESKKITYCPFIKEFFGDPCIAEGTITLLDHELIE